jgi:DNA-binding NtrC family response regulator
MKRPPNILVIDDEHVICIGCKKTLEPEGMVVDCAENGLIGLAKLHDNEYDIVLIDVRMPTMGGMDVMSAIKKMDKNIIPIIITGYATVETSIKAKKNGAFAYLAKPFTPDELRSTIKKALTKRTSILK